MSRNEYEECQSTAYPWSCIVRNENLFPFKHIVDDTEFISTLPVNHLEYINLNTMSELLFFHGEFNEDPLYIPGLGSRY